MELTRGRYSRPQMSPWSLKIQGHPTSNRRFSHLESKSCSTVSHQFGCLRSLSSKLLEDNVSAKEVTESVQEEPALAAAILKTVNSAYYGLPEKMSSLHHAI